jgi:hypothetical protein
VSRSHKLHAVNCARHARSLALSICLCAAAFGTPTQAAQTNAVKVYTKVQMIAGVTYARATAVTSPEGKTSYILVALSDYLGGFVEIAPTCVGADKLSYQQIRERVAEVEAAAMATADTPEVSRGNQASRQQAFAPAQANRKCPT